jgi:hypothetical protein
MDLDRFKYALREALRDDAERIKARGGDRMEKDLYMLMQGAEHCLAKRLEIVTNTKVNDDDPAAFKRGWEIASQMNLNPRNAAS